MSLPVGTVLAWDRAWSTDLGDDPVYAIIRNAERAKVLCGGSAIKSILDEGRRDDWPTSLRDTSISCNRVVHPDDWPDEVCAKVAEFALLGELK
jgi:hypothetical protein